MTTKYDWTDKWWENAFNNVASKFAAPAEIRNNVGASSSSSSSSSDSDSAGAKKREDKKKKLRKSKKKASSASSSSDSDSSSSDSDSDGDARVHRDGVMAKGATADELAILERLQKDKWGRWGGRDGKMARVRAMEEKMAAEARAKLEGSTLAPTDSPAGRPTNAAASAPPKGDPSSLSMKGAVEVLGKGGRKRVIVEVELPASKRPRVEAPPTPTPKEGWWGATLGFVSAGFMGGADKDTKHERKEFTENDQEKVYMAAHAAKTSGKGGLGIGKPSGASKLGNDFKGQKKTFGEDAEEEPEAERPSPSPAPEPAAKKSSVKKEKKGGAPASGDEARTAAASVPWKKVIRKLLEAAGSKGLKLKKLQQVAVEEGLQRAKGAATKEAARECFNEVLNESSKFIVEDKIVRLKA